HCACGAAYTTKDQGQVSARQSPARRSILMKEWEARESDASAPKRCLGGFESATWKIEGETPNRAERVAAYIGGWALMLAARLSPPNGPFFSSDGRLLADTSLFIPCRDEHISN